MHARYRQVTSYLEIDGEEVEMYGILRQDGLGESCCRELSRDVEAVQRLIALLEDYNVDKRQFMYIIEDFIQ